MVNRVVLDLFLGDSGKGKIVDLLAKRSVGVIRFNGSNNAGHTLSVDGKVFKTHAVPSGVLYQNITNFIAHGCAINPEVLFKEIAMFPKSKVVISGDAHIIFPHHIETDCYRESLFKIGTTKQGVGPVFEDKAARRGLRYKDFLLSEQEFVEKVHKQNSNTNLNDYRDFYQKYKAITSSVIIDGVEFIHQLKKSGDLVFEGAQGTYLDVDLGHYPYCTSSNTTIGAVFTGTGISPKDINEVVGIFKAYGSYVGTREDFLDIEEQDLNDQLCDLGQEFGATTGRRRRLCWLDLDQIKRSIMINGCSHLGMTRLDTLGQMPVIKIKFQNKLHQFESWGDLKGVSDINQLPLSCMQYISFVEKALEMQIAIFGVGAEREAVLFQNYK